MVTEPPEVDSKTPGVPDYIITLALYSMGSWLYFLCPWVCLNFQRVPIGLQDVLGDPHEHLNYNKGSRIDIGHPLSYTHLT